jgi:hypothetical protein
MMQICSESGIEGNRFGNFEVLFGGGFGSGVKTFQGAGEI